MPTSTDMDTMSQENVRFDILREDFRAKKRKLFIGVGFSRGPEVMKTMGRPYQCPKCKSTNTSWKGWRPLTNGKVRLRKCRNCGRKFTSRITIPTAATTGEPQQEREQVPTQEHEQ
jgi:ribosomal protein L37AE/L43A